MLVLIWALAACGGGGGGGAEEPELPCGGAATCDPIDPRALAAVALDDGRIVIAAYDQRQRGLVVAVARPEREGTWDPESLHFTLVAPRAGKPLAMARAGAGVHLVYGSSQPPSLKLARLDLTSTPRLADERTVAEPLPLAAALAATPTSLTAAWLAADSIPRTLTLPVPITDAGTTAVTLALAAQSPAAIALGNDGTRTWLARASPTGVDLVELTATPAPVTLAFTPATAVAMDGPHLAWSDADGVHLVRADTLATPPAPVHVDDGARSAEPAHRVGAALSLDVCPDGTPLVAFQDQTSGALVTARIGPNGPARTESLDRRWTGAMHTAVACPVVLDLAARSAPLRLILRAR